MTQKPAVQDADGLSGVLVICVDPALGKRAAAVCRTASRKLLASPVLGGYVETHVVMLPSEARSPHTAELITMALSQVTPGAERYFCGVLMLARTQDFSEAVETALRDAAFDYQVRSKALIVSQSAGSPDDDDESAVRTEEAPLVDVERSIRDAVYELAQQLWDDADHAPERGATLGQLAYPKVHQKSSSSAPPIAPEDDPADGDPGASDSVQDDARDDEFVGGEHAHEIDAEPRGTASRRSRWRIPSFRLPMLKRPTRRTAETDGSTPEYLVYLVLLADATAAGERWHRARAIIRAIDKELARLPEGGAIRCRYLLGGATILDRTPLQPAGSTRRPLLKSSASPYINVAQISSDLRPIFDRDRTVAGTARPGLTVVLAATSTPMIDASAIAEVADLSASSQVIWIILDDESASMLERLGEHGVHLRNFHPEVVDEIGRLIQNALRQRPQAPTETQAGMTGGRPIEGLSGRR